MVIGVVMPEKFKVIKQEAQKLFNARLHMTDHEIRYQEDFPPVPAGDSLTRWSLHILPTELQVPKEVSNNPE